MTTRSWTSNTGGTWSTAADWSGGAVPGPGDDAIIAIAPAAAPYTVTIAAPVAVHSVTLNQAQATLDVAGSSLNGSVALQAGTLELGYYDPVAGVEKAGTLTGAVSQGAGQLLISGTPRDQFGQDHASIGGTLSGVTWQGLLSPVFDPAADGFGTLVVAGGLTLTGSNGSGNGSLLLNSAGTLDFADTSTLDHATVTLKGANISTLRTGSAASMLTLGSGLVLNVTGQGELIAADAIINAGAIDVTGDLYIATGTASDSTGTFVNTGSITFDAGGSIDVGSFNNTGTIAINNGAYVNFPNASQTLSKTIDGGAISVNAGTLFVGNNYDYQPILLENTTLTLGVANSLAPAVLSAGAQVTLAATTKVIQAGLAAQISLSTTYLKPTVNDGTIIGSVAGGMLTFGDVNSYGQAFVNNGTIAISNGDFARFGGPNGLGLSGTGTISVTDATAQFGTLDANGLKMLRTSNATLNVLQTLNAYRATLRLGHGGTNTILQLGGVPGYQGISATMNQGTIIDNGGGVHFIGHVLLNQITYRGTVVIDRPYATVELKYDMLTNRHADGAGSISLTGAQAVLLDSTGLLDQVALSIGNAATAAADAPRFETSYGTTLGTNFSTTETGVMAAIGNGTGTGNITGSFTNEGTITATKGLLTLDGLSFTNSGTILASNDTLVSGSETFTNLGLITVTGATLALDLTNYFQSFTTAPQSFSNDGTILLTRGTISEQTQNGLYPVVPLLNAGTIEGAGMLTAPTVNDGRIEASSGTLAVSGQVTGTGTLQVDAGAALSLSRVAAGQIAAFSGTGGVLGLMPMSFLGTIASFAAGDTLDIKQPDVTAAAFSGSTILLTLASGATETLHTATPLTGALVVTPGTHADSLVTFAAARAAPYGHVQESWHAAWHLASVV